MKSRWLRMVCVSWLLIAAATTQTIAQDGRGGVPGAFLYHGVGARALGMGGAYTAIANDVTGIYWNPAGLATMNPFQISFMHTKFYLDTSLDFFAFTAPSVKYGSFALAMMTVNSGDFEQRTALNEVVGSFDSKELAFFASWSRELFRGFALGFSYKMVEQSIMDFSARGHGLDLGIKGRLFGFDSGLTFRNLIRPKITLSSDKQTYPMQISAGFAKTFLSDQLLLSMDFSKIAGWGKTEVSLGGEFRFVNRLALRAGVGQESVTFGAGFSFGKVDVGYGNAGNSDLGLSHRYSLDYSFGGLGVVADATPKVFSPTGELNISRISLKVKSREKIQKWSFAIKDVKQRVIREFNASGVPPKEIIWDGRDATGALVEDGSFTYLFAAKTVRGHDMRREGLLVAIDSQGPQGLITGAEDSRQ
ncbi:PorV/PorQ family protein [bacterium]|nr:PorV/PorQ family protein [bacterium]